MAELGVAFGLVLVLEGVLYALFPQAMQRVIAAALTQAPATLRNAGLAAAFIGFAIVWLVKSGV